MKIIFQKSAFVLDLKRISEKKKKKPFSKQVVAGNSLDIVKDIYEEKPKVFPTLCARV